MTDPVYLIGDLSTVRVITYIRETEASVRVLGRPFIFTVVLVENSNSNVLMVQSA